MPVPRLEGRPVARDSFRSTLRLDVLVPALLAVAAHAVSLGGPFVFDDYQYVVDNPNIRMPLRLGRLMTSADQLFAPGESIQYRPLLFVVNHLNYLWAGLEPRGWHVLNVSMHVAAVMLVGLFARLASRAFGVGTPASDREFGFWTAGIFAVHPFTSEAIAYVSGRSTAWVSVLLFAGLCAFWRSLVAPSVTRRVAWLSLAVGVLVAAALSHEAAALSIVLTLVLSIAAVSFRRGGASRLTEWPWLSWGIAAVLVVATLAFGQLMVLQAMETRYLQEDAWRLSVRALTSDDRSVDAPALVAGGSIASEPLFEVAFYRRSGALFSVCFLSALAIAAAAPTFTRGAPAWLRRSPYALVMIAAAGLAWALIRLDPHSPVASGLMLLPRYLRLAADASAFNADFRLHGVASPWSAAAVFAVVGLAVVALSGRIERWGASAIGGLLYVFALLPFAFHWGSTASDRRLYTAGLGVALVFAELPSRLPVLRDRPRLRRSLLGIVVLALFMATVRRDALWSNPEALWRDAIGKDTANPEAWCNLALTEFHTGATERAAASAKRAVALRPRFPEALNLLGLIALRVDDLAEADSMFKAALASGARCYPEGANNLGVVAHRNGDFERACRAFRAALSCGSMSNDEVWANLGLALEARASRSEAAEAFARALALNPANRKAAMGLERQRKQAN